MRNQAARFYIYLSIGAALLTMIVKFIGFWLTNSAGLFSDAAESIVNLVAALIALWVVTLAARPADDDHSYGHTKAEYFSSGAEGALIVLAATVIIIQSIPRLFHPHALDNVGPGLAFSLIGGLVNALLAAYMWWGGKRLNSIVLKADARHLMTDVVTTVGVLIGVLLCTITGWLILDSIIGLLVALNVLWTGFRLLRETGLGLMDTALPEEDRQKIMKVMDLYRKQGLDFHALRTRQAGSRRFISFHVLVPGSWSVHQGHTICDEIEIAMHHELSDSTVFTHLEPSEDASSWADLDLDRVDAEKS